MASLTHALLTEDEAILLDALGISQGDRVLALFAYGNGDAGLSLLQAGAADVFMLDLFDQKSLAAQFQLKQWLFSRLDNSTLRFFLGVEAGPELQSRESIFAAAMADLPEPCRAFWERHRISVLNGIAGNDSTATWCRTLHRFQKIYRKMPGPLRRASLLAGRCLAPFYFPREERRHSLGYRQLMANPERALERIINRLTDHGVSNLIPYGEFQYLSSTGHDVIRQNLHQVRLLDRLPAPAPCNVIYLSNIVDYLSPERFHALLSEMAASAQGSWRAFLNSSFDSLEVHPHLRKGIQEGLFHVDANRTERARTQDRVGVYPGLTVLACGPKP